MSPSGNGCGTTPDEVHRLSALPARGSGAGTCAAGRGTPAPVADVPSAIDARNSRARITQGVRPSSRQARAGDRGEVGDRSRWAGSSSSSRTIRSRRRPGPRVLVARSCSARRLNDELDGKAVVLHDRKMPGTSANIDHIVIGPNGVWVIDAKRYDGDVELRDVGGWRRTDLRLYVNNRDQTKLTAGLDKQHDAVRAVLDDMLQVTMPIKRCLCFVKATWPLIGAQAIQDQRGDGDVAGEAGRSDPRARTGHAEGDRRCGRAHQQAAARRPLRGRSPAPCRTNVRHAEHCVIWCGFRLPLLSVSTVIGGV